MRSAESLEGFKNVRFGSGIDFAHTKLVIESIFILIVFFKNYNRVVRMPNEIGVVKLSGAFAYEGQAPAAVGQMSDGKTVKTIYGERGTEQEKSLVAKVNTLVCGTLLESPEITKIEITKENKIIATHLNGETSDIDINTLSSEKRTLLNEISHLAKNVLLTRSGSSYSPEESVRSIDLVVSQEVVEIPVGEIEANSIETIQNAFIEELAAADKAIVDLQTEEDKSVKEMLKQIEDKYVALDKIVKDSTMPEAEKYQNLQALRTEYAQKSLELKTKTDAVQEEKFNALEKQLHKMTKEYNKIIDLIEQTKADKSGSGNADLKDLERIRDQMHEGIQSCNQKMNERSLTTHPATVNKSHLMSLAAVIEKKLTLHETVFKPKKGLRDFVKSLSASKKLGQGVGRFGIFKTAPQHTALVGFIDSANQKIGNGGIAGAIEKKVNEQPQSGEPEKKISKKHRSLLPCFSKVKDSYTFQKETFAWGKEYLNVALTAPANWTVIRKATIKESGTGRMYVAGTENKPLNITEKGGVPAGLRKANGYRERATNLIQTTSYILSDDGERQNLDISFRGGQFPTVAAAKEALSAMLESGVKLDQLHINALLTPMATVMGKGMPDRKLLVAHKKNLMAAIEELKTEAGAKGKQARFNQLAKIKENFSMSNFGVNEGAVGQLKKMGMRMQWLVPGWHTSIKEYSNEASKKLTGSLNSELSTKGNLTEYDVGKLDKLGAIVQVGQEMEAVWATNAYAEAGVGNNQFKLPALWKTMDALLDVTCYTDCMSGKDRTGKVESHSQSYLDEIAMNTIEHKKRLAAEFTSLGEKLEEKDLAAWQARRSYLTAACFTVEDLNGIYKTFKQGDAPLGALIKEKIEEKLNLAKTALGVNAPNGFMEQKTMEVITAIHLGTTGISKNTPKLHQAEPKDAASAFPRLTATTIFSGYDLDWNDGGKGIEEKVRAEGQKIQANDPKLEGVPLSEKTILQIGYTAYLEHYRKKHIEAGNSRNSQIASLMVTGMNTSVNGFKVEGGEPLARATCGFDRDYVLLTLYEKMLSPEFEKTEEGKLTENGERQFTKRMEKEFIQLVGLNEFDQETQVVLLHHFREAGGDLGKHLSLIKKIEHAKMETFFPQTKVKA